MKIYVLITEDESSEVISGVYSSKSQIISALTTTFKAETLNRIEIWDVDSGFVGYLKASKRTTVTFED